MEEKQAATLDEERCLLEDFESPSVGSPRIGESSTDPAGLSSVRYTFNPRWPITGEQESALGVLGRTKEETIGIVQRGFRTLSQFPPERIEFLVSVPPSVSDADAKPAWIRIMDETWSTFERSPPEHLMVQIEDGPGDADARKKRETNEIMATCCFFIVAVPLVIGFFVVMGRILDAIWK